MTFLIFSTWWHEVKKIETKLAVLDLEIGGRRLAG